MQFSATERIGGLWRHENLQIFVTSQTDVISMWNYDLYECHKSANSPPPSWVTSLMNNPLQEFGEDMKASDKRMTSERCAHLSFVAIVNQLEEAWLCFFPALPLIYVGQYMPTIGKRYSLRGRLWMTPRKNPSHLFTSNSIYLKLWQNCKKTACPHPPPKKK